MGISSTAPLGVFFAQYAQYVLKEKPLALGPGEVESGNLGKH
jgi:hypothetical protein